MQDDLHQLQCLEVWGGNDEGSRGVAMPGLDAWVLSRPSEGDASGGDIHYVSSCASGVIARVLLADVAGHGTRASEVALRLRTLMRRHVQRRDQSALAEGINAEFAAMSDDGRFATALIATHFAPTGDVDITVAGHPPPFVRRARAGRWEPLSSAHAPTHANTPLGVLEEATYRSTQVRLADGDSLLLYTDGLVEARAPDGRMLGADGLARLLGEVDPEPAPTFVGRLYERARALAAREHPEDDCTLLLLRRNRASVSRGIVPRTLRGAWHWVRTSLGVPSARE